MKTNKIFLLVILAAFIAIEGKAADRFVTFSATDFMLNASSEVNICIDRNELRGVGIAAANLATDIFKVTGTRASVVNSGNARIVVGTIGHSKEIDLLIKQKKIDGRELKNKHEKYILTVVDRRLIIAGSDRRGAIYGIYELSSQIGVSPWYYWADTPIEHHPEVYIKKGVFTDGEPAVRYRGIFINDEAPCLTTWVLNTFKTHYGGHEFYAKVCELILRLKGNYLWPAMWNYAFYADDSLNSKTADDMGVVIGTSHHEPMARNHEEWARAKGAYGAWNYATNQTTLDSFFRKGIERMKNTEDIVTIGMRGDGDEAMSADADTKLLKRIIANQRNIIADVTKRPASSTPQLWALYKEVLEYYDKGLRVPDDVTIMLCDDNWGNVRRVPSAAERNRGGGWGLYYHVDYVGAPRNSKWLNVTPTQNMWEQLSLAYDYGINRIWILNVGDIKPMEYPIDFFMNMAWHPKTYDATTITTHTRAFCAQQFGEDNADEAAKILNLCCKYAGRTTAEMLNHTTYNLKSGEWKDAVDDYLSLENAAMRQYMSIDSTYHDVYRELILFPVQAMSNIYQMYYAQAMNLSLYENNDPEANHWADEVHRCFLRDSMLCREYNKQIAQGKWDGMMTQKHIGYTSWNDDFKQDTEPITHRVADTSDGGFVFSDSTGCVSMEAQNYYAKGDAAKAQWTVIPYMGRTLSGISLQPYTVPTDGAFITYKFRFSALSDTVSALRIHVITKSTLDFLNKGGLIFTVSVDDGTPVKVNFNHNLNENKENIYTIYYPTVARRVVDSKITMPLKGNINATHTLTLRPLDPAIVIEKIVVDAGSYTPQFLFGKETDHCREMK